jgi:hypothetical protein
MAWTDDAVRVTTDEHGARIGVFVPDRDPPTGVELFVNFEVEGEAAQLGVALTVRGDVVAILDVVEGRPPELWLSPGVA